MRALEVRGDKDENSVLSKCFGLIIKEKKSLDYFYYEYDVEPIYGSFDSIERNESQSMNDGKWGLIITRDHKYCLTANDSVELESCPGRNNIENKHLWRFETDFKIPRWFFIINKANNKVLDVSHSKTKPNSKVILYKLKNPNDNLTNQQWCFKTRETTSADYRKVRFVSGLDDNLALDIHNSQAVINPVDFLNPSQDLYFLPLHFYSPE